MWYPNLSLEYCPSGLPTELTQRLRSLNVICRWCNQGFVNITLVLYLKGGRCCKRSEALGVASEPLCAVLGARGSAIPAQGM